MSTPKRALTYDLNMNRDPRVREGDMPEGMVQREIATADTTVVVSKRLAMTWLVA